MLEIIQTLRERLQIGAGDPLSAKEAIAQLKAELRAMECALLNIPTSYDPDQWAFILSLSIAQTPPFTNLI